MEKTQYAEVGRDARTPIGSATIGSASRVMPNTTLQALAERLMHMAENHGRGLHGIAGQLEQHADVVHGPVPKSPELTRGDEEEGPYYGAGALAQVWVEVDALDRRLNSAIHRVAIEAGRNSTLA